MPGSPSHLALLVEVDHRIYIYDLNTRGTVGQQAGLPKYIVPDVADPPCTYRVIQHAEHSWGLAPASAPG